jgi:hypothetical protein
VIESFRGWAEAATESWGGDPTTVFVLREDVDFLTGSPLRAEATRVARAALGLPDEAVMDEQVTQE